MQLPCLLCVQHMTHTRLSFCSLDASVATERLRELFENILLLFVILKGTQPPKWCQLDTRFEVAVCLLCASKGFDSKGGEYTALCAMRDAASPLVAVTADVSV